MLFKVLSLTLKNIISKIWIFNPILLKVNYLESIEGLGNLIIKVVPLFTVLSTEIIPPCS